MRETHASLPVVKRIRKAFWTKLSPTQQGNIAIDLYIKACRTQGLTPKETVAKLRRNLKTYLVVGDNGVLRWGTLKDLEKENA